MGDLLATTCGARLCSGCAGRRKIHRRDSPVPLRLVSAHASGIYGCFTPRHVPLSRGDGQEPPFDRSGSSVLSRVEPSPVTYDRCPPAGKSSPALGG